MDALTQELARATAASGMHVVANLTAYKGIWQQAQDVEPLLARPEVARVPPSITFNWVPERNTYVRRFGGNPAPFARWYAVLLKLGQELGTVGLEDVEIGDTVADIEHPEPLPTLKVDEPTLTMLFRINDSPFSGREGSLVTSRQLRDRLSRRGLIPAY